MNPDEPLTAHHGSPDPTWGPLEQASQVEVRGVLRVMVGTLPPRLREVLVLCVALGLSVERTAQLLEISRGAVRLAQHRALTRLRADARADDLIAHRLGA